jgi:hypothetical protein
MKQHCSYHPTVPAHWHCDQCGKALCPQCVDSRDKGGYSNGEKLHMCPNCNLPVRWLGVGNIIDPFWKRIPRFFVYPFCIQPLIVMLTLSLISALLLRLGVIGLLSKILVWGVTFKYAYAILKATAGGDLTAPPLSSESLVDNFGPVVKQVGIYIAIFFTAGVLLTQIGLIGGGIFVVLATLFLPAMIILLVTTESLFQAINPLLFVTLAYRIGWGYLLMYFFCSILGGAPALLGQHVIQHFPPPLQVFFFTLVKIYYTFISYHLMGYVILQYHDAIGYRVDFEDFKDTGNGGQPDPLADETPAGRLLRRVNQMVKDGNHDGARTLIENEADLEDLNDPVLSERYYTLLKITGAAEKLTQHGLNHLKLLVQGGRKKAAIEVYSECLAKDPGFAPRAGILFKLGGWLNESGNSKAAIGVFNKLTKVYPQDPLVPKSYFQAARIFNDLLRSPDRARKILNGLLKKYPDHDIIPFVERYLGEMG